MYGRSDGWRGWRLALYAGDVVCALAAWYGAVLLRITVPLPFTRSLLPPDRLELVHPVSFLVVALQLLCLYFWGAYESPEPRPRLELALRMVTVNVALGLFMTGYFFLFDRTFPRSVLVLFVIGNTVLLTVWRTAIQRIHRPRRRRVALVGASEATAELAQKINEHHWHGLDVVGYFTVPDVDASAEQMLPGECLGTIDEVADRLAADLFDDLILAPPTDTWETRLVDRLAAVRPDHTSVLLLPGPVESLIGRMRYRWVSDIPLIQVVGAEEWRLRRPLKRTTDLVLGASLLLITIPVMALCALAVRFTSRGPVLYRQTRIGRDRRPFTLLKFRTMLEDAEGGEEVLATADDPRLTPVGRFLRRTRLDELPQLFNVLTGSMSLVGPRPERPGFVHRYLDEIPGYAERFTIAPGITGLAQVNGEYHSSPENKLRYDLAYLANWNLGLDLAILFRTVRIVLSSRGV